MLRRRSRLALVGAATLALFGAMGAGHAESTAGLSATTPSAASAPASGPRFVPSAQAKGEVALAVPNAPAAAPVPAPAIEPEPETEPQARALGSGVASYYGRAFAGRPTASGERFDPAQMTAAHRTLPFGSLVRVTNPRNGREVVVRINDRGPFHKGRTIDLSQAAAEQVGIVNAGSGTVDLALLEG